MSILVGDNFSYSAAKPLDGRLKYDTVADMKAVGDATMYDGCMAYCSGTDKTYQWKSTNSVDETTGRWREFTSGGGSTGGGHTIEDSEGTDLTQRDTLQFGEGFKAEDDIVNEKTVVTPNLMPSEDMSEVVSPLPSKPAKYPKYSTTEQIVAEWIDGKPLYQKTIDCGALPNKTTKTVTHGISNIDSIVNIDGIAIHNNDGITMSLPMVYESSNKASDVQIQVTKTSVLLISNNDRSSYGSSYITIQYTKTTD